MTDTAPIQSYYCCHTCGFISDDNEEVREHITATGHRNLPPVVPADNQEKSVTDQEEESEI